MHEYNKTKLSDQTKFRLYETKKLNKYITIFDYIDKILIALSATAGGISIISFTSIIGVPAGIASASFTLILWQQESLKITKYNKKKKRKNMIKFLC